jgi:hypothetical protein
MKCPKDGLNKQIRSAQWPEVMNPPENAQEGL